MTRLVRALVPVAPVVSIVPIIPSIPSIPSMALALALVAVGCGREAPAPARGGPAAPAAGEAPVATTATAPPSEAKPAAVAEPTAPTAPTEPTEIVLWHAYRGDEKAALEEVVAGYGEGQKRVRIRLQAVPWDPFVDKITITVPRGQGPDLFIFAHNMIGKWVEEDILEPLSGRVGSDVLGQFLPQAVKALVYRKNLYGLPLAFKSLALFYNKRLLPEAPASMEELVDKVKAVQAANEGVHGFVYEAGLLYNHAPWMHALGGRVFDDDGKAAFDTPEQAAALDFAHGLFEEHGVLPRGMSGFMVTKLFNDGQAAAVLNGPWFRAEIAPGVDYGVAPIPTVQGKTSKPFLGIEAFFINKHSDKKDAALEAALYLVGEASAKVRLQKGKQPVAHAATLRASADPALKVFLAQAEDAVVMPSVPEMQLVWSTADSAINGAVFAGKPAKEVLAKAQAKIADDMANRGR